MPITATTNRQKYIFQMRFYLNLIAFQIGWFACVFGAAHSIPVLGPMVVLVVIALHLFLSKRPYRELSLIGIAGLIGLSWDSFLVIAGLVAYPSGMIIDSLAPYWIIAMWMLFATTLNVCLRWLRKKYLLSLVLGAFLGPLTYYSGAKIGGISLLNQMDSLISIGLGWAVILPLLSELSRRLDGSGIPEGFNHLNV